MDTLSKFIIYTDGSFHNIGRNKKSGIAFLYIFPDTQEEILAYSFVSVEKSTQTELLAIIYSIKYFIKMDIHCDFIEILCDDISIVDFFNNKEHIICQNSMWKKPSGKPIRKCVEVWHELSYLVSSFPEGKIVFLKADKGNEYNKLVHDYANTAAKLGRSQDNTLYTKRRVNKLTEFNKPQIQNFSDIQKEVACTIYINNDKPWQIPTTAPKIRVVPKGKKIKWINAIAGDVSIIATNDIVLTESIHFNCKSINLQGLLKRYAKNMTIDKPIAVRSIDNNKYALVMGLSRFIVAKVLNIPTLSAFITEHSFNEFKQKFDAD